MFSHYYADNHGIFISERKNENTLRSTGQGILFLDRDGVIIEEKHYLSDPEKVKIINGAQAVIHSAAKNDMRIVIVTNQSAIARGLCDWKSYINVTNSMIRLLADQAFNIDLILACPMHPDAIIENYKFEDHPMRKPNPGMINFAINKYNSSGSNCMMVGDKMCDINAGIQAGIKELFQVKTGHGANHRDAIIRLNKSTNNKKVNCINSIIDLNVVLNSRLLEIQS